MIIKIVQLYLGLSLVVLWAVWGQFIFRQFLGPAYISQDLQARSYVVSTNDRVLIYCTCHFQGGSLCFSFFCLLVSSVSVFHTDTRGMVVDTFIIIFLGSLVQSRCGEGGMLQTNNTGLCSQCLRHAGPAPAHGAHRSGSRLLRREPSEASPGLHAPPRSKPLRLRHSGSPQRRRLSWACVLCPSQVQIAQVFGERSCRDLSPFPSLPLGFLGVHLAPLLRWMVTAQNPKKSQLAKKLACSLVVNVSLGLRLPPSRPSRSGCLSPEGDDLQPANSVPSFVLCAVLAVVLLFAWQLFHSLVCQPKFVCSGHAWGILAQIIKKHCSLRLPAQPQLASGGCRYLRCFSAGGVTIGHAICGV